MELDINKLLTKLFEVGGATCVFIVAVSLPLCIALWKNPIAQVVEHGELLILIWIWTVLTAALVGLLSILLQLKESVKEVQAKQPPDTELSE